ncbi:MAG: hypothetical protein J1E98_02935 [Lachnospiraceae bacterium]|nr:hypothetical protein [Lachnospiraceae bacterium]
MLQMIREDTRLREYCHHEISDAGVKVNVDERLRADEYIGIKVDDCYAGLRGGMSPKSVDFIVVVDCECNSYVLYILELKGVKRPTSTKDIQEKFDTTINHFMSEEFAAIFLNDRFRYKDIKLYLVTTAYAKAVKMGSFERFLAVRDKTNRKDSLLYDSSLSDKSYRFRGKICRIQREVPPNPLIRKIT